MFQNMMGSVANFAAYSGKYVNVCSAANVSEYCGKCIYMCCLNTILLALTMFLDVVGSFAFEYCRGFLI